MVSHWVRLGTEEPFVPNLDKFGFVYLITNTKTTKAYVGCKQYYVGKTKKKYKWEIYTGSSKYLNADIKKIGKEHFTFEVIAEYKNKRSLRYYEAYYQIKWNVLTDVIEGTDEPAYYNSYVGGKWYRPVESYTDPEYRKNLSDGRKGKGVGDSAGKYQGKAEFYLDNKLIKVDCLGAWCNENGYDRGAVNAIARTTRDGFTEGINIKGGPKIKRRSLSCKGPLGTITKVKRLGKEVKDVSKGSNVQHSTS
jgi:hypothetical protein